LNLREIDLSHLQNTKDRALRWFAKRKYKCQKYKCSNLKKFSLKFKYVFYIFLKYRRIFYVSRMFLQFLRRKMQSTYLQIFLCDRTNVINFFSTLLSLGLTLPSVIACANKRIPPSRSLRPVEPEERKAGAPP
jgi:hypothetical protein